MAETQNRWSQTLASLPRLLSLESLRARGLLEPRVLWAAGALAVVALLCTLWLWWLGQGYVPLYGRAEQYDTAAVMDVMEREGVAWRLHPDTGQVTVNRSDLSAARMALAAAGIVIPVAGTTSGRKEHSNALGTSHFMERAYFLQDMEEALAATVRGLDAVRRARVHLSVPEQSAFLREQPGARASVFVDLYKGQTLSPKNVRGIVALVAGSVAGLKPDDVSVVDQSGTLISQHTEDNGRSLAAEQCFNARTRVERHLENQVARLLEAVAGPGNFRVDVAVEMDFSSAEQATEDYGPESGVLRSESIRMGDKPPPSPTSVTVGKEDAQTQPQQLVRNYEINKHISRISGMPGKLERLTVAVLLNYRQENPEEGDSKNSEAKVPWEDTEIAHLKMLIQQAVGYDEKRADSISVTCFPFFQRPLAEPATDALGRAMEFLESSRLSGMTGVMAVVLVLLLLMALALWMLVKATRKKPGQEAAAQAAQKEKEESEAHKAEEAADRDDDSSPLSPAPGSVFSTVAGDRYFEAYRDGLLLHVREEPNRVAAVLNKWIGTDLTGQAEGPEAQQAEDTVHG